MKIISPGERRSDIIGMAREGEVERIQTESKSTLHTAIVKDLGQGAGYDDNIYCAGL